MDSTASTPARQRRSSDVAALKQAAAGRWPEILTALTSLPGDLFDGRHRPCPKCGGADRFRAFGDFAETGGTICNQCAPDGNPDGIATLVWLSGETFLKARNMLIDHLGPQSTISRCIATELVLKGCVSVSDCTISPVRGQQNTPDARNYPATVDEAKDFLDRSHIGGYRIEQIGEWCVKRPDPLPDAFFDRLVASVALEPKRYGRLFLHALRAATEGGRYAK